MVTSLKEILNNILIPSRGMKPFFEVHHVIKMLLILYEKGSMGRQLLSKNLGIGITSVRTLIKRLKSLNLIYVDPVAGCILTPHGIEIAEKIRSVVSNPIEISGMLDKDFLLSEKSYGFLIKNGVPILSTFNLIEVRDLIIRYGAKAVIIIYLENGITYIPPYKKEFNENIYPSLKRLRMLFNAEDKDVMILIFSNTVNEAEKALYSTLLELNILR